MLPGDLLTPSIMQVVVWDYPNYDRNVEVEEVRAPGMMLYLGVTLRDHDRDTAFCMVIAPCGMLGWVNAGNVMSVFDLV